MEPIRKEQCALINFKDINLASWRSALQGYAEVYGHLFIVSDTETTGTSYIDKKTKEFHRVVEWSSLFMYPDEAGLLHPCLDKSGNVICLDEPLNPFLGSSNPNQKAKRSVRAIPTASIAVHGITAEYLFGNEDSKQLNMDGSQSESGVEQGVRPATGKIAASFDVVYSTILALLSSEPFQQGQTEVTLLFHNAHFDVSFLNIETEIWGMPYIESYFSIVDTWKLSKKLIPSSDIDSYALDACFEFVKSRYPDTVKKIDRPVHTALIDANILAHVYNGLVLYHGEHA
ncbi:hypothetical protein [Alteromonas sp. 14N.309.X.WAT.G.H12]|uniref:hypothetical protein n=1 Tax=Alteromonas sp. 14N.309.X.WAT.G.H12 TaxID=3120824 RepID=UPI002FD5A482